MFFDSSVLEVFFSFTHVLLMCGGVLGGVIIGALPGLTPSMAVALLVPVTFGMDMSTSIFLLVSTYVGGISGGLISASLLNIPGTPASVATTFDAYPMVQRGEAGKALSFALFASLCGGLLSFVCLALLAPALGRFALRFGSYEYFALVVFTLSCIASISKKSLIKGLLAAVIGIIISLLGMSQLDGMARMTFGFECLENGISVMPVLIGMYAISQIMGDATKVKQAFSIHEASCSLHDVFHAIKHVLTKLKIGVLRASCIGLFIGILPGIGPSLANIVAYSQAQAASSEPGKFGTGIPDGIIASEAANNASTGGALIPLLSLGIPGDVTTMMLLAAFTIHGIQPGPLLFKEHADIVGLVMAVFCCSTLLMYFIQILCMRGLLMALRIKPYVLYPIILGMCVIGCYSLNSSMFDVWTFLVVGVFGYLFNRIDLPMLPMLLGLILGRMAESEFRASYVQGGNSLAGYLDRPIALCFFAAALLSVVLSLYMQRRKARATT